MPLAQDSTSRMRQIFSSSPSPLSSYTPFPFSIISFTVLLHRHPHCHSAASNPTLNIPLRPGTLFLRLLHLLARPSLYIDQSLHATEACLPKTTLLVLRRLVPSVRRMKWTIPFSRQNKNLYFKEIEDIKRCYMQNYCTISAPAIRCTYLSTPFRVTRS